jgi:putative SOS response-associated peptidase YedK
MGWGLIPLLGNDPCIGCARSMQKLGSSRLSERSARRSKPRCLVSADAFYEWQKLVEKTKQPFAIARNQPYAFAASILKLSFCGLIRGTRIRMVTLRAPSFVISLWPRPQIRPERVGLKRRIELIALLLWSEIFATFWTSDQIRCGT